MSLSNHESEHPFSRLSPDTLLDAVEALGFLSDGRTLALNSYENRVFQVGIEDAVPVIVKFYRPGRWSEAAIREEHQFAFELQAQELPVVAPWRNEHGESLFRHDEFHFALYERKGGRDPELEREDVLEMLGRLIGRMHAIGAQGDFQHRLTLDITTYGHQCLEYLLKHSVPADLREVYESVARDLLQGIASQLGPFYSEACIRVHGDLHRGNILWRDDYFHFVDLDDCCQAPAVQDLWMLLSGERHQQQRQIGQLLKGYTRFCAFQAQELRWIESLRSLRMIHYSAWLARREDDPAFQKAFPWFGSARYWGEQILSLREQRAALDEPTLEWRP